MIERDMIETHHSLSIDGRERHFIVGCKQFGHGKSCRGSTHLIVFATRYHCQLSHVLPIDSHHHSSGLVGRERHSQRSCIVVLCTLQSDTTRIGSCDTRGIIEISATLIPCIVINLIERMRAVGMRLPVGQKGFSIDCKWIVALSQEITTVIGIGITDALMVAVPRHRACCHQQTTPIGKATGCHFMQIVGGLQIVCRQPFRLQGTTIAIDFNTRWICKSCISQQFVGQLIDA